MVLNFAFVRNPNYYKCHNPNSPPIHVFTLPKTSVKQTKDNIVRFYLYLHPLNTQFKKKKLHKKNSNLHVVPFHSCLFQVIHNIFLAIIQYVIIGYSKLFTIDCYWLFDHRPFWIFQAILSRLLLIILDSSTLSYSTLK